MNDSVMITINDITQHSLGAQKVKWNVAPEIFISGHAANVWQGKRFVFGGVQNTSKLIPEDKKLQPLPSAKGIIINIERNTFLPIEVSDQMIAVHQGCLPSLLVHSQLFVFLEGQTSKFVSTQNKK